MSSLSEENNESPIGKIGNKIIYSSFIYQDFENKEIFNEENNGTFRINIYSDPSITSFKLYNGSLFIYGLILIFNETEKNCGFFISIDAARNHAMSSIINLHEKNPIFVQRKEIKCKIFMIRQPFNLKNIRILDATKMFSKKKLELNKQSESLEYRKDRAVLEEMYFINY